MMRACPRCSYSLRGLPETHACPECGLGYDDRSRSWWTRGSRSYWIAAAILLYCGVELFFTVFFTSAGLGSTRVMLLRFMAILYVLGGSWFLFSIYKMWKHGVTVSVVVDGIITRMGTGESKLIPWANISRTSLTPGAGKGVTLLLVKERTSVSVADVFRNREEAESFVAAANAYLHQSEPPPDDTPSTAG